MYCCLVETKIKTNQFCDKIDCTRRPPKPSFIMYINVIPRKSKAFFISMVTIVAKGFIWKILLHRYLILVYIRTSCCSKMTVKRGRIFVVLESSRRKKRPWTQTREKPTLQMEEKSKFCNAIFTNQRRIERGTMKYSAVPLVLPVVDRNIHKKGKTVTAMHAFVQISIGGLHCTNAKQGKP